MRTKNAFIRWDTGVLVRIATPLRTPFASRDLSGHNVESPNGCSGSFVILELGEAGTPGYYTFCPVSSHLRERCQFRQSDVKDPPGTRAVDRKLVWRVHRDRESADARSYCALFNVFRMASWLTAIRTTAAACVVSFVT